MRPHTATSIALAAAILCAAAQPAAAQAPAAAAQGAIPAQEISVVTVLGRLAPKRAGATIRRIDRSSASSCAFDFTASAQAMIDEYMDHFHGRARDNDGNEAQPVQEGEEAPETSFRDTSPYGDAANDKVVLPAGCTKGDRAAAAGRNYIARKDKTLDRAFALYDKGDFAGAMEQFKTAYKTVGWDEAALMLGDMYLNGEGVKPDLAQAAAWYTRLANARTVPAHMAAYNPASPEAAPPRVQAQLRLAGMAMQGAGVPKDAAAARRYYADAERLNYIPARYTLGRMLLGGVGGDANPREGERLLASAAEYGYAPAQWALARAYDEGGALARDGAKALGWYQQAAFNLKPDSHKPHALLALARMYDQGGAGAPDPAKALAFYKASAVAGHPEAQNALATYFYEGNQVAKDLAIARKLFIAAASQGQADAMANAGVMLFKGEGGAADPVQSYVWLRLAEKVGNQQAAPMAALVARRLTEAQRSQAEAVLNPKPKG